MAAQQPRRSGKFVRASGRDPIELCAMTKAIAAAAAEQHPDPARLPEDVSTREWNAARLLVPGGESMPLAWETARQIGGGEAVPWRELLRALLRAASPEQALRMLTREEPWLDLGNAEISFALLAAEQLLGADEFLQPWIYKEKHAELLRRDRRRKDGGQLRLPTLDQILTAVGGDWRAACRVAGIAKAPPEEPTPQRIRRDANHWSSREALIGEMRGYIEWLRGSRSTQRKYHAYRTKHAEAPSLETVQRYGGLDALIEEAKRLNAIERARAADRAAQSAEAVEARRAKKLAEQIMAPQAQRIIDLLADGGLLSATEIATACGLSRSSARRWLGRLVSAGVVRRTHPIGTKNLRFQLPIELSDKQKADADARRGRELLRSKTAQRVLQFFENGAEATTEQTAEALGISVTTARTWIKRLTEQGKVARRVIGLPGSGRSYVYHRVPPPDLTQNSQS